MGRDVIKYTPQGYIDMRALLNKERSTYIWITGARGSGKTYGAIDYLLHRYNKPFIIMRRTIVQAGFAGSLDATPLKPNLREGQVLVERQTKVKNLYHIELLQDGEHYNDVYIVALSGVASMRGIDLQECDWILYDEFIKEPHERPISHEYEAFKNALETLGRNRELNGLPPMRLIALSNALDIGNPYFQGLNIVDNVFRMTGDCWRDPARSLAVYRPASTQFIKEKKKTALYLLDGAEKTLGNTWQGISSDQVASHSLRDAKPICNINEVAFYRIGGFMYARHAQARGVKSYDLADPVDRAAVHRENQYVIDALFYRKVTFENVATMLYCADIVKNL